jgi:plasmid stabilization system protein ParE
MAYIVEFLARDRNDIDEIVAYIHADSPSPSTRWRQRLEHKMQSLRTIPEACGAAPESDASRREVRQLLHGRYRVLFTVEAKRVFILTIRHCARQFLGGEEVDSIE